jgi:hypothetical protein
MRHAIVANDRNTLEQVQAAFERWRATRGKRRQIPPELWTEAVRLVGQYPICRVARALRVDYRALKGRVGRPGSSDPVRSSFPFIEVGGSQRAEWSLEVEDGRGRRLALRCQGVEATAVVEALRAVWESSR